MAICTEVVNGYLAPQAGDATICAGPVVLSATEYVQFLSSLTNFGWNQTAFEYAVGGGLLMFAVGFGIGMIINQVRKAGRPF